MQSENGEGVRAELSVINGDADIDLQCIDNGTGEIGGDVSGEGNADDDEAETGLLRIRLKTGEGEKD
jgi:hypothetical protein